MGSVASDTDPCSIPPSREQYQEDRGLTNELKQVVESFKWWFTLIHFLPSPQRVETQVKDSCEKTPLTALMPIMLQDSQGRVVARVGPVNEDLEGRVVHQMAQNLQFDSYFLHECLERLRASGRLTEDALIEELFKSPLFAAEREALLRRGLKAYLESDLMPACSLLVPEIEAALRQLLALTGGEIYKPSRVGGLLLRSLEEIFSDEKVRKVLDEGFIPHLRTIPYLRTVLTDQRGWNVRNEICHGLLPSTHYDLRIADRLVHILLLLSRLRKDQETAREDGEGESSAQPPDKV